MISDLNRHLHVFLSRICSPREIFPRITRKAQWSKYLTGQALCCTLGVACLSASAAEAEKETLKLDLPAPTLKGTPEDLPAGPNLDPLPTKPREPYSVVKGVKNVALNKPVSSSVKPFSGELEQITDGKKEAFDYDCVEMRKGPQWIQLDLGEAYAIHAIVIWHDHRYFQVMRDVIVQLSDDPEFKTGVTTVFNNDSDNSAGQGAGGDREYFENHEGRIVDAKGVKARYLRAYTNGSSLTALNAWQEMEVYALPVK